MLPVSQLEMLFTDTPSFLANSPLSLHGTRSTLQPDRGDLERPKSNVHTPLSQGQTLRLTFHEVDEVSPPESSRQREGCRFVLSAMLKQAHDKALALFSPLDS